MAVDNDRGSADPDIQPYRMHVSARYLELTRQKLELARLPRELTLPAHRRWEYGTPKTILEPLLDFWLDGYDWRAQETAFNESLPQFRTTVHSDATERSASTDLGLKVHFVHKRSPDSGAVPLLFCHGWPSSFTEVSPIIKALTEPGDEVVGARVAFHLVAPSIPGFGFSDASSKESFGARATADVFDRLMKQLGYQQYIVHGDAWGFTIARKIALHHEESCRAIHTCIPNLPQPSWWKAPLASAQYHFARLTGARVPLLQFGYVPGDFAISEEGGSRPPRFQPTGDTPIAQQYLLRPQTLAYSVCDSPVGLLACTLDAIHSSSNTYSWTPTDVLNWTMMQWLPGPEAALRWLKQADQEARGDCWSQWSGTPLGVSTFRTAGEGGGFGTVPPPWASAYQKVIFVRRHHKRARLPAWDAPAELVVALRDFTTMLVEKGVVPTATKAERDKDANARSRAPGTGEVKGAGLLAA